MKIYLATDHAGFLHKEDLKKHLLLKGFDVKDFGTNSEDPCDYPDFIFLAAKEVSKDPDNSRAIIFGGSGQGEAMVANRVKNVRATVYYGGPFEIIELSREHNNANILSIGARFVTIPDMKKVVDRWISLPFSKEERHLRRIQKIDR